MKSVVKKSEKRIYVIHEHHASHLHYDLRLEMDGVLKSWAVPKIPPMEKGTKRLAISVEDHELGYEEFQGIIPKGHYGAGKVRIWDKGHYTPLEIKDNSMVFDIHGKKLKGVYCLIKLKPKPGEKDMNNKNNWLFFKR